MYYILTIRQANACTLFLQMTRDVGSKICCGTKFELLSKVHVYHTKKGTSILNFPMTNQNNEVYIFSSFNFCQVNSKQRVSTTLIGFLNFIDFPIEGFAIVSVFCIPAQFSGINCRISYL
jgi:hypothetical protein